MIIQPNSLLVGGTSKAIQFVNTCVIAKEGPNMVSKMGLGGLNINYDSVLTTKQTLKVGDKETPIMYGWVGSNITFLMLIPTYNTDIMSCSGKSNYIEYYYEDDPLTVRTFTDILVLSGNDQHRIPQIYLYNPNSSIVTIDIMAANLDVNTITSNILPSYTELKGLSYNSILSDQMYGINCTGSTQFEIVDILGNVQMAIPYNKIDIITIKDELLTVTTKSDDPIQLTFLSKFQATQALSRMNWVMKQSVTRFLTATYPTLDTSAPVVTYNFNTTTMNYVDGKITPDQIRFKFISSVIDYDNNNILRDGTINRADVNVLIMNINTGEQVEEITYDGRYSITFTVKDLAGNSVSSTKTLIVDSLAPVITYNKILTDINTMSLLGDSSTPGTIEKSDINMYYINNVWDDVDGVISNSAVTITISVGSLIYPNIDTVGDYTVVFSVSDTAGNITTGTTTLRVVV